jgi:hypothetical protein
MLLFPCDPLKRARPDPHFADEYVAARDADIPVALIDHDAAVAGEYRMSCKKVAESSTPAVYRGWMLRPSAYAGLERALSERDVLLKTTASKYELAHHLPQWYGAVRNDTPESVWTMTDSEVDFIEALRRIRIGPAVIKDYSKSAKHYWNEAMFIPDTTNEEHALAVARRFRELRGEFFDVGYVIRSFEQFEGPEVRTWWVDGRCVLVSPHPDAASEEVFDLADNVGALSPSIDGIGAAFITADIVQRSGDGRLRIVEIGDGQVSDRSSFIDSSSFITSVVAALNSPGAAEA